MKVGENFINADKIGDEMYLSFINECRTKGKADFFDPIKKVNLDKGLKKMKRIRKVVSVMKEDGLSFGVMLGEEANLEEAFPYPVTSVALSLGFQIRLLDKIQNIISVIIIDISQACESTPPNEAR